MAARKDCAVVSIKDKVCAIAFEGSDDSLEPIEPAFRMGTVMINGYEVWRGCAREYRRFKEHPEFGAWMRLATDSEQCQQVYITGHSLGAAVAVLHRLDVEFGRLVTFAAPPVFAPYSYPQFCFGDSFHMQQDIVKAFPLGFRLGGVREHSFCTSGSTAAASSGKNTGSPGPRVMESKGCNGFDLGEVNFCDIHAHHVLSKYRSFIDDAGVAPQAGVCADTSPGEWIDKCVTEKCAAHDPRCAMGAEVLRASLSYESMRATAIHRLRPGQPPALFTRTPSSQLLPPTTTSAGFEIPDLQALELLAKNGNLCPAALTSQYPATAQACAAVDATSFLLVHASKTATGTAVELEALYFRNVGVVESAPPPPTAALVVTAAALVPEENAVVVHAYPKNAPNLKLEYKLAPKSLLCRGLDETAKVCVVYGPVGVVGGGSSTSSSSTALYTVDVYVFLRAWNYLNSGDELLVCVPDDPVIY